jgi:hypothetical protein
MNDVQTFAPENSEVPGQFSHQCWRLARAHAERRTVQSDTHNSAPTVPAAAPPFHGERGSHHPPSRTHSAARLLRTHLSRHPQRGHAGRRDGRNCGWHIRQQWRHHHGQSARQCWTEIPRIARNLDESPGKWMTEEAAQTSPMLPQTSPGGAPPLEAIRAGQRPALGREEGRDGSSAPVFDSGNCHSGQRYRPQLIVMPSAHHTVIPSASTVTTSGAKPLPVIPSGALRSPPSFRACRGIESLFL